ncbi:MAG TPA: hypothetical protein VFQ91_25540 [Bryobacteraceae bacterium]|nr:hypothetical protein [Bryobacteraceae bacterium]
MPSETESIGPPPASIQITIVLRAGDERDQRVPEAGPLQFWRYVSRHIKNGDINDSESYFRFEQLVASTFGRRLREMLITDYEEGPEWGRQPFLREFGLNEGNRRPRPNFAFQVAGFRYGSLSLDLDVTGLKALVEFFDGNAMLCQMVLAQYAPLALAYALTDNPRAFVEGLNAEVLAPTLGPAFATFLKTPPVPTTVPTPVPTPVPAPAPPSSTPGGLGRLATSNSLTWAWIASNTSLLIPVLLSLVVLYFGFVGLDRERDRVWQAIKDLTEKQNEVLRIFSAKQADTKSPQDAKSTSKLKDDGK